MSETWALNLFDRLHAGHHVLLDRLSEMPNPVAGVTTGELAGTELELQSIIQPPELRLEGLRKYLDSVEYENAIRVEHLTSFKDLVQVPGGSIFLMFIGPCCVEIEERLLEMRKEHLQMEDQFELLKPVRANDGDKMASARIRLGEIDREGRRLRGTKELPRKMGDNLRSGLAAPKGDVYAATEGNPEKRVVERIRREEPSVVIAVGDVTCATLATEGYIPGVRVVDGITKRGPFEEEFSGDREYIIYNPAATIYPEAWSVMDTAIRDDEQSLIVVEGEEDLMGFPAVLLAPDGSVMLYGQPDVGIVWVPVTEENRSLARAFLEEMPVIE